MTTQLEESALSVSKVRSIVVQGAKYHASDGCLKEEPPRSYKVICGFSDKEVKFRTELTSDHSRCVKIGRHCYYVQELTFAKREVIGWLLQSCFIIDHGRTKQVLMSRKHREVIISAFKELL